MQMQVTVCKVCSMLSFNHYDGSGAVWPVECVPQNRHGIAAEEAQECEVASLCCLTKEELMYSDEDFHHHDIDIEIPW